MRRALRHVSDEHALQMLRSPHPPFDQAPVVAMLLPRRGDLVLRALEQGIVSANVRMESGAGLVHLAAMYGPLSLL